MLANLIATIFSAKINVTSPIKFLKIMCTYHEILTSFIAILHTIYDKFLTIQRETNTEFIVLEL